jgi:hypothetical protein
MFTNYLGWVPVTDSLYGAIEVQTLSREAVLAMARKYKIPYVICSEAELNVAIKDLPFPFVGMSDPKGWRRVDSLFVDHSGYGAADEPALSIAQLSERIREYLRADRHYGYGVRDSGQFQLWLGVFEKTTQA